MPSYIRNSSSLCPRDYKFSSRIYKKNQIIFFNINPSMVEKSY